MSDRLRDEDGVKALGLRQSNEVASACMPELGTHLSGSPKRGPGLLK